MGSILGSNNPVPAVKVEIKKPEKKKKKPKRRYLK